LDSESSILDVLGETSGNLLDLSSLALSLGPCIELLEVLSQLGRFNSNLVGFGRDGTNEGEESESLHV